ncbi:MAG: fumarate reductase/succinate dehydrogenase flavoprotein subunit, partial [Gammaproteobacteria bacterium]|nr:fumarate reductase/succinate dehydrogenase flavoprotein subunit [Gammaproteobacteria bacterium]
HQGRGTDYRKQMIEMHISEIGFCSGHSASGVYVDENARTTIQGLYAAGDMANVPHNYMLGAFTNGAIAGEDAIDFAAEVDFAAYDQSEVEKERTRVLAPTKREDGIPPNQIEYKTRRLVNDYLQPPKVTAKMELAQQRFAEVREDMDTGMYVRNAHELMRSLEASTILDCADMAAHASLYRQESRWGLYHNRVEYDRNDEDWFCHTLLTRDENGLPSSSKQAVKPYIVEIDDEEKDAYNHQRVTVAE